MQEGPLSGAKDDLSHPLREAARQDIVIIQHGRPAGVMIGFKTEDDRLEYQLLNDPRFSRRSEGALKRARAGKITPFEEAEW